MPATKAPAKKRTTKATRKGRPAKMSASHKKALAEGRSMSATVDRYVSVIGKPKRRGRKVTTSTIEARITQAKADFRTAHGVERVLKAQEIRDLEVQLAASINDTNGASVKELEAAFIKIGRKFSEKRKITYGAWREGGVSAEVLRKAGIARTRG